MEVSASWWLGFNAGLFALLALDLGVVQRKAHALSLKEAGGWSVFWTTLALVFCAAIWGGWVGTFPETDAAPGAALLPDTPAEAGMQFLTAYIVELSLSVDNLFVFAVLFKYFRVDAAHQHRVLFWGIVGAVVLRAVMILGGVALLEKFDWIMYLFGALLLYSGWKLWSSHGAEAHPERNLIVRWMRRAVPMTHQYDGARFFTLENGRRVATPMLAVLVCIETTDVIFAVDSIPAVLAVTREPFLAYASNMFAILGLRSLYFLLAGVMSKFWLLHYGLAVLLGFIGVKMLISDWYHLPGPVSLGVIALLLGGSIAGSLLLKPPRALASADGEGEHGDGV